MGLKPLVELLEGHGTIPVGVHGEHSLGDLLDAELQRIVKLLHEQGHLLGIQRAWQR